MQASLVMFSPDGKRRDFDIKPSRRYIIGRKESCDLRIPLTAVSREHAAVYYDEEDEEYVIEDLGSSNGTFVNNEKVEKSDLCPGDVIVIGPVPLQVVINGHPADLKPLGMLKPEISTRSIDSTAANSHHSGKPSDKVTAGAGSSNKAAARSGKQSQSSGRAAAHSGDAVNLGDEDDDDLNLDNISMPDDSDSFFAFDVDDADEDEK